MLWIIRIYILFYVNLLLCCKCDDEFHETMLLRPLTDGSLFAEFKFTFITRYSDLENLFYDLFPKSIGQLFIRLPLWQFDLSLTHGRWDYSNWGSYHSNIAPIGAQLHAVFFNKNKTKNNPNFNIEWLAFQQILTGLYCASINEINIQIVNNTKYQFIPAQLKSLNKISNHKWSYYYGIAPKENICTENLTPFTKLLPCRQYSGISVFLNPHKLFSAHYQSMQVHIAPSSNANNLKMTQIFQLVLKMKKKSKKMYDIKKIFNIKHENINYLQACPVADSSLIIFDNIKPFKPVPHRNNSHFYIYSLKENNIKNIKFKMNAENSKINQNKITYLETQRYLISHNLIAGQLVIVIKNTHLSEKIRFSYFDPLPHFVKLYFHSMTMMIINKNNTLVIDPFVDLEYFNIDFPVQYKTNKRIRNENPICMEWVLTLAANSELRFTMNISKKFQHFESYPPDYNRGFDIGSGMVKILDDKFNVVSYENGAESQPRIIYTADILILLPYPDMSMVFNVIAFSCTLFAFFFGTAFNNLYRDIEDLDKRNVHFIRDKLKAFFMYVYQKIMKCKKKDEKDEKSKDD